MSVDSLVAMTDDPRWSTCLPAMMTTTSVPSDSIIAKVLNKRGKDNAGKKNSEHKVGNIVMSPGRKFNHPDNEFSKVLQDHPECLCSWALGPQM
jgi:hypothetical protein